MMRLLTADEIECRVATVTAKGCSLLLYKTARVDRAILDETFGAMNWQNDFKCIDGKMYGSISVYDKEKQQWITKSDCGVESNTEAEKGQASDCFKRAGFKWGIGVELYSSPFIWVNCPTEKNDKGKFIVSDRKTFKVQNIDYSKDREIVKLEIVDNKGNTVFELGKKIENKEKKVIKLDEVKPASNKEFINDNDLDIINEMATIKDLNKLIKFKDEFKSKVSDEETFKRLYIEKYKALNK